MSELEKVNLTPGPVEIDNIIRLARDLNRGGQQAAAHAILQGGWPRLTSFELRRRVLEDGLSLADALNSYQG